MKEVGIALLVFLLVVCMMANNAWAGAQVYFTISIGGGVFIGVIGVCIQAVFQQRIVQEKEEPKPLAVVQSSELKSYAPDLSLPQVVLVDWVSPDLDPPEDTGRAIHPDLEVNFLTFRW